MIKTDETQIVLKGIISKHKHNKKKELKDD